MKKMLISSLISIVMIFMLAFFSSAAVRGDIDGDSSVTAADARLALRFSVGLEVFSAGQVDAADMDADGIITAGDARTILRLSVGLSDENEKKDQFEILRNNSFYLNCEMSQNGVVYEKMDIAVTDNSYYLSSELEGVEIGILISDDELYMLYPEKKAALHMSESLLGIMEMSKEDLISSADFGFSYAPGIKDMKVERTEKFRNKDCTVYSYFTGAEKIEIYMCGDSLVRMVFYDSTMKIISDMVVNNISEDVSESYRKVPSDYKIYKGISGMFEFMNLLEDVM